MLFIIDLNRCCVCRPASVVLRAPGQAIPVTTADSPAAASAAPAALAVRLRPVSGERRLWW